MKKLSHGRSGQPPLRHAIVLLEQRGAHDAARKRAGRPQLRKKLVLAGGSLRERDLTADIGRINFVFDAVARSRRRRVLQMPR